MVCGSINYKIFILPFIFLSCSINDNIVIYEQKLVLWANIEANSSLVDTVFVSRTSAINENINSDELWISNAEVWVRGDTIDMLLYPVTGRAGRYFTDNNYDIFWIPPCNIILWQYILYKWLEIKQFHNLDIVIFPLKMKIHKSIASCLEGQVITNSVKMAVQY